MLDFYMGLPAWLSGVAVIGACVVICVGGHLLVRAIIPRHVEKQETELAVALMGVVAAFIGIMLAFAAVQVWDDYNQADHAVAQEAASIAQLYRDLTVYGDEAGPSRVAVKTYVRAVLEDEWPRLSHGQSGPKAAAALIQLFNQVGQIRPETNRQTVIYGEAFKKLNEVVGYRRARLITARAELPGLFWIVVVAGSAVMVAFTFAFPATRTNSLIIAGLAVSLGLIFMFILDVNRPYAGVYSVDSKELSDLLPLFDKISGPAL